MQRSTLLWLVAAFAVFTTLETPQVAQAQSRAVDIRTPHRGTRPLQLDLHGGLSWHGWGAATGARFGIPILHNGFVPSINNAVYINFGVDFYWIRRYRDDRGWHYGAGVGLPVALHWEFYFHRNWSAFAELGVNVFFHPRFVHDGRWDWDEAGAWVLAQIGGRFHINDMLALTLRVGNPYTSFGLTLMF